MTTTADDENAVPDDDEGRDWFGFPRSPEEEESLFARLDRFSLSEWLVPKLLRPPAYSGERIFTPAEIFARPVGNIEEAIVRMEGIQIATADRPHDGLAEFNRLYLLITSHVRRWLRVEDKFFVPGFLESLDVEFANRYFAALNAWATGAEVPWAWGALLNRRADTTINPFQFAMAGVNAHINYDLAPALVAAKCTELLDDAPEQGKERKDYEAINDIFLRHYANLRERFIESPFALKLDRGWVEERVDDICHLVVDTARDLAWKKAGRIRMFQDREDLESAKTVEDNLDLRAGPLAEFLLIRGFR